MKKLMMILGTVMLVSVLFSSCNYGRKKMFNGVELYYTSGVTAVEADRLGQYLIDSEFADGERKTVQLNREGSTYEFRMVVKKGIEQDQEYCDWGKEVAADVSEAVFYGAQVDVHFCDDYLNTLRVLPMSGGTRSVNSSNMPNRYSGSNRGAEEVREAQMVDLFERLDRYFLSALQNDEKLMQLIILASMDNNNHVLENRIDREMEKICEQWAADNNIDLDDWSNSTYAEDFAADYMLHLIEEASKMTEL